MIWPLGNNKKEMEKKAWVDPEKCTGCCFCLAVCPVKAIKLEGHVAMVIPSKCINCGICRMTCPEKAIE